MTLKEIDETELDQSRGALNPQDEDDNNEEDGEKKPAAKPAPAVDDVTLKSLTRAIQDLRGLVQTQGSQKDVKTVSRYEQEIEALAKDGYTKESLLAIHRVIAAKEADLQEQRNAEIKAEAQQRFITRCQDTLRREIDDFAEKVPSAKWSKEALYAAAVKAMEDEEEFAKENETFKKGNVPDFKKIFRKVSQTYLKDSGIKSGDKGSGDGIDTKNSRTRPSAAISKDGSVDVTKLTDYEREIYTATLNALGGKNSKDPATRKRAQEIALQALRDIGPKMER
jgi:hypothetical protein